MPMTPPTAEERDIIRAGKPKPAGTYIEQITEAEAQELAQRFGIHTDRELRSRLKMYVSKENGPPLWRLSRYFFDHPRKKFELEVTDDS